MDSHHRLLQIRLMAAQKVRGMSRHDQAVSWGDGGLGAHFEYCRDHIADAATRGLSDEELLVLFMSLKQCVNELPT
ncbi:MAG: hypothetical protein KBE09_04675 [Candidatus Pacebacteria bacterium]|nr:hypothetical protein [Candidatus Paceibacterota bacterium]